MLFDWLVDERAEIDETAEDRATRNVQERYPTLSADLEPSDLPDREGFEWGIPRGGTQTAAGNSGHGMHRRERLEELFDIYEECQPVSASIDSIARAVTAGGLRVVPDDDIPDDEVPDNPPPEVERLKRLLRFTNLREDLVQLARSTITDLLVCGDSFIEISWLLSEPVALYSLEAGTMQVDADEHGKVLGYKQWIDAARHADFKPEQIIHISLDAPRGGLHGLSPTSKAMVPIMIWLWATTCLKEQMRSGNMPRIHADFPRETNTKRWWQKFMTRNRGPRNISTPIITKGGATLAEMSRAAVHDYQITIDLARDMILSEFGTPPNKVQVIESGNLGGGTGEAQDKTWRIDAILPLQNLLLEKLQTAIVRKGFGIEGWHLEFEQIDMRDSKTVEDIRVSRLRNGAMTLNEYLGEISQPGIGEAGDVRIFVERGVIVAWEDIKELSVSEILHNAPNLNVTQDPDGKIHVAQVPASEQPPQLAVVNGADDGGGAAQGIPPKESGPDDAQRALMESYTRAFQHRRKKALKSLPKEASETRS